MIRRAQLAHPSAVKDATERADAQIGGKMSDMPHAQGADKRSITRSCSPNGLITPLYQRQPRKKHVSNDAAGAGQHLFI